MVNAAWRQARLAGTIVGGFGVGGTLTGIIVGCLAFGGGCLKGAIVGGAGFGGTLAGIIAGGLAFGGCLKGGVATMVGGIVVFGGGLAGINCFT